jgi:putative Mg2+ transporter-C (MgtC) family protein
VQGIVTGIGFLGAGVIMHEGLSTRGLSTAASIWTSAAIGVMIGVGFYAAAIMLALLAVACMTWLTRLECKLPSRQAIAVVLQFRKAFEPREDVLCRAAFARGYEIAISSLAITYQDSKPEWHFVALALGNHNESSIAALASELSAFEGVEGFRLSHARN